MHDWLVAEVEDWEHAGDRENDEVSGAMGEAGWRTVVEMVS